MNVPNYLWGEQAAQGSALIVGLGFVLVLFARERIWTWRASRQARQVRRDG